MVAVPAQSLISMVTAPAAAPPPFSVQYCAMPRPNSRMSAMVRFCRLFCSASSRLGIRMAAIRPMIAITISSSIRVNPALWVLFSGVRFR